METDQCTREARDNKLNQSRTEECIKVGDMVLTRNFQKTKFQPTFGPQLLQVTKVENGAIKCTAEDGSSQLRHSDDVKRTIGDRNNWWILEPQEEEPQEKEPQEEESHEEELFPQASQNETARGKRPLPPAREKSTRARRPNPNLADYVTDY